MTGAGQPHGGYSIGIDIGGTKMLGCLFGADAQAPIDTRIAATAVADGGDAVLGQAAKMARALTAAAPGSVGKLGVAIPELVDRAGRPASAWSFDWRGLDIEDAFDGATVHLESDVRAAAFAESRLSELADTDPFLYVTWSTGIAHTLVIDGRPYGGANGYAIHFAGGELVSPCGVCGAVTPFNLENRVGGRALAERYCAARGQSGLTARDLMDAAANDDDAAAMVDEALTMVASHIGQLINIVDPAALVVGGGIGTRPEIFDGLRSRLPDYIWAPSARSIPVARSALDGRAAAIGAVLLAANSVGDGR